MDCGFVFGILPLLLFGLMMVFLTSMRDLREKIEKIGTNSSDQEYIQELETVVRSFALYAGNYGAWKAQQEFRDLISKFDSKIENPYHFIAVDSYLKKLVCGLDDLSPEAIERLKIENLTLKHATSKRSITLKSALGVDYYYEIQRKNPDVFKAKSDA